jgi:exodeoxyribonuclease VII large subunit
LHPRRMLDLRRQQLDERERRLHWSTRRRMDRLSDRAQAAHQRLEALNPLQVMARGYSIVQRTNGHVVRGPDDLAANERLQVRAAHGEYTVTVAADHPKQP